MPTQLVFRGGLASTTSPSYSPFSHLCSHYSTTLALGMIPAPIQVATSENPKNSRFRGCRGSSTCIPNQTLEAGQSKEITEQESWRGHWSETGECGTLRSSLCWAAVEIDDRHCSAATWDQSGLEGGGCERLTAIVLFLILIARITSTQAFKPRCRTQSRRTRNSSKAVQVLLHSKRWFSDSPSIASTDPPWCTQVIIETGLSDGERVVFTSYGPSIATLWWRRWYVLHAMHSCTHSHELFSPRSS